MADEFDTWQFPGRLVSDREAPKAVRVHLVLGERARLVATGQAALDDLLALTVQAPGVLVVTTSTEPTETVDQLVESAWVAVVEGQAKLVIEWGSGWWADGTVLRPGPDGLVGAPAVTPEKLARVIKALGRPGGALGDADDPLEDWLLLDRLRPGAVCSREDRVLKNARWFITDGRRVRSLLGGDASLSDLTEVARTLPAGLGFVTTGQLVASWGPPLATVEELASEAWVAVLEGQVYRVVTTPSEIDGDGRLWVNTGYRYARKGFRAISTGDAHLLALTHDQLLERLVALTGREDAAEDEGPRQRSPR